MNPVFTNTTGAAFLLFNILAILLAIWGIAWKVYAVWIAANRGQKKWFFALLVLNTMGILEIIYIFKIVKKPWAEVKKDFRTALSDIK